MGIEIVLVAALADNGVIGQGGRLPWRLKSDMQHFRRTTIGKPVVMGRKTYSSLGKPLAGRTNIVVSRDRAFAAVGVLVAPSLQSALAAARGDALRRGVAEIAIIGGADLYAQTLAFADYAGNRQMLSTGNLAANDRVALFLMDYPQRTRLKILGHARVEDAREHPELVRQLSEPGAHLIVERLFFIEVVSFDWNCPKFITPRYTIEEVQELVAPLKARITELEAQLKHEN